VVAAKAGPDYLAWGFKLFEEFERRYPGYQLIHGELVEGEERPDGSVTVLVK